MPSNTKVLALIACLSATNVALRIALAGLRNVKPIAFLDIVAGIVGRSSAGFFLWHSSKSFNTWILAVGGFILRTMSDAGSASPYQFGLA